MPTFPNAPANPWNIMDVLGPDGRPYKPNDDQPAPRLSDDWTGDAAGTYSSILQFAVAIPGYNNDTLIQNKGYDEADRMMQFSSYMIPQTILYDAVTWKTFEIVPAVQSKKEDASKYDRAQKARDFCHYLITNILDEKTGTATDFRDVLYDVLDGVRVGFSVVEKLARWYGDGPYKGKLGLRGFVFKEQKSVGFWLDRKTLKPLALNLFSPLDGYEWNLPIEKFLLYTFQPKKALPYGWGTFRTAHRHVVMGDLLIKLWAIILERFGGGFLMGHYDNNKQKSVLIQAMELMKRGAGVALPRGLEITLEQMAGNGVESLHHCIDFHKRTVTEIILGQSLTTSQGEKGSYAHASVHKDTQEFKMAKIRKDIEFLVQGLFRQFLTFNFGELYNDVIPSFSLGVWNWQEIDMMADALGKMIDRSVIGPEAPFLRKLPNLPPFDPDVESRLPLEADKERLVGTIGTNGKLANPSARPPSTKAMLIKPEQIVPKVHTSGNEEYGGSYE